MSSSDRSSPFSSSVPDSLPEKMVSGLALSLSTAPVLLVLVGAKALSVTLRELGELSEEVFRGDRLPLLQRPDMPPLETPLPD